jgi:hemoglobin-like flavoprotein
MSSAPSLNLSPRQKRLLRESFESIREYSNSVVLVFYGRLFEIAPQVRPLFKIEIRDQASKLMDMLTSMVDSLDHLEALRPQLEELGRRHAGYNVKPEYYQVLLTALMWAFGHALGMEFSRETRAAWEHLLTAVSAVMLEGAQTPWAEPSSVENK